MHLQKITLRIRISNAFTQKSIRIFTQKSISVLMEYVYNSFSSNYKPWVSLTCAMFENELWLIIDMRLTATKSFKGILVCKLLKTSLWFFLFFFYSIEISFTPLSILCIFFVKDYPLSSYRGKNDRGAGPLSWIGWKQA